VVFCGRGEHGQAVRGEPVAGEVLLDCERGGSSVAVPSPARRTASAATSAMCSGGMPTPARTWSATLRIVLVHSTSRSALAALKPLAAADCQRGDRPGSGSAIETAVFPVPSGATTEWW
jgi:hypothetical protein